MQEQQQETGMATPSEQPSTATLDANQPPKLKRNPNRRERRSYLAMQAKMQRLASRSSGERLANFRKLTTWKDREANRKNRLTDDQITSVFRIALDRLFKGKEIIRKREKVTFDDQLTAIVRNVKRGVKYKSDVAPEARPIAEETPPTE